VQPHTDADEQDGDIQGAYAAVGAQAGRTEHRRGRAGRQVAALSQGAHATSTPVGITAAGGKVTDCFYSHRVTVKL
jgi:hypothetical protein